MPQPEAKSSIQVIERMMSLLDVLAHHQDAVSLKQLSRETGLHPSTAHRILGDRLTAAIVIAPAKVLHLPRTLSFVSGHPLPDAAGVWT